MGVRMLHAAAAAIPCISRISRTMLLASLRAKFARPRAGNSPGLLLRNLISVAILGKPYYGNLTLSSLTAAQSRIRDKAAWPAALISGASTGAMLPKAQALFAKFCGVNAAKPYWCLVGNAGIYSPLPFHPYISPKP